MLSLAADFWPTFWAVTGGGALVTVMLSLLVAVFSPTWFRPHRRHRPAVPPAERAGRHGHYHRARRGAEAA